MPLSNTTQLVDGLSPFRSFHDNINQTSHQRQSQQAIEDKKPSGQIEEQRPTTIKSKCMSIRNKRVIHIQTTIPNPSHSEHLALGANHQATMPENKKPWFCKPCEAWCHSDMKTCPKCIKKEALRFPIGDSSNPRVGGASKTGVGRVPSLGLDDVREGGQDVSAAYEAREGGRT